MKRIKLLIYLVMVITFLSSCGKIDTYLENKFLEKSGILENEDYQSYSEMDRKKQLGDDGSFIDTDIFDEPEEIVIEHSDLVHVTFAENSFFYINYYEDVDCTEQIDKKDCYLNPGDYIYASVENRNPNTNAYGISGYHIIEYGSENEKKAERIQQANSSFVYQIPLGFLGNELSIVPIGEYIDRELSLSSYYTKDDGKRENLGGAGNWFINGNKCTENHASISPIESYVLKYDFDEDNYFFVSSNPRCFTEKPNEDGFVEFYEANPTDEELAYSVELHPYLKLIITLTKEGTIRVNSLDEKKLKPISEWYNTHLSYGDVIVIETKGECNIKAGDYLHVDAQKDPINNNAFRYTLKLTPEINKNLSDVVNVNEYVTLDLPENAEHGTCTYKLDGKKVTGTITMQESQQLSVTYKITDPGYVFSDKNILDIIQDWFTDMEKEITIPVTAEMNNKTINPDEVFSIVKVGE